MPSAQWRITANSVYGTVMASDAELRALALAVRSSFDSGTTPALDRACRSGHLHRLAMLAARHRVEGLAWCGLHRAIPGQWSAGEGLLKERAAMIAARHLVSIDQCRKIYRAFSQQGCDLLFLKGRVLAALAHERPQAKDSCDIDILVPPAHLLLASRILYAEGYRLIEPELPDRLASWHACRKESVWIHDGTGMQLDLHTQPIDNLLLAPDLIGPVETQDVSVGGDLALPTFADPFLFAYLCIHGASSAWFRLSWLADLAALLRGRHSDEISALHRHAERLGAGRASGQALLLLHELFGVPLSTDLKTELADDRAVVFLRNVAWRQLLSDLGPTERPGGSIPIRLSQALLGGTVRFAIGELARQAREILTRP